SIENLAEEVLFLGLYEKMLVKLDILEMKKTDLFASFFMIFNKRKKEVLWLKQNMTRILKKVWLLYIAEGKRSIASVRNLVS
ncbi:hypothetical protein, partial [Pseudomonas aeruginosa]